MLSEIATPLESESQRRLHLITCKTCKRTVETSAINRKFCDECRIKDTKERTRRRDAARSLALGRSLIGSQRFCPRCKNFFQAEEARQIYCRTCQPLAIQDQIARATKRSNVKFARISIGAQIVCAKCDRHFVKVGVNQKYCSKSCSDEVRNPGRMSIGSELCCRGCQKQFITTQVNQKLCLVCRVTAGNKRSRKYVRKNMGNPYHILNRRMGSLMRIGLKGTKSRRSWKSLVDYTVHTLKRHIERQFIEGMSWDRRGEWHIDHIVPLKSFSFQSAEDDGFKAAWALTNLRPLWAKDNLAKRAQRLHLL